MLVRSLFKFLKTPSRDDERSFDLDLKFVLKIYVSRSLSMSVCAQGYMIMSISCYHSQIDHYMYEIWNRTRLPNPYSSISIRKIGLKNLAVALYVCAHDMMIMCVSCYHSSWLMCMKIWIESRRINDSSISIFWNILFWKKISLSFFYVHNIKYMRSHVSSIWQHFQTIHSPPLSNLILKQTHASRADAASITFVLAHVLMFTTVFWSWSLLLLVGQLDDLAYGTGIQVFHRTLQIQLPQVGNLRRVRRGRKMLRVQYRYSCSTDLCVRRIDLLRFLSRDARTRTSANGKSLKERPYTGGFISALLAWMLMLISASFTIGMAWDECFSVIGASRTEWKRIRVTVLSWLGLSGLWWPFSCFSLS